MVEYDEAGSIGKRYRRQDAIGTPFCITIDFDTATDQTVTIRERDTMKQIRLPIDDLIKYFNGNRNKFSILIFKIKFIKIKR
jgi:glycyl-tRNA synthetase